MRTAAEHRELTERLPAGTAVASLADALDYAKYGDDRHGFRQEAHRELQRPGAMLRRITGLAGVDPELVLDTYRRRLAQAQGGKARSVSEASNPGTARLAFQP